MIVFLDTGVLGLASSPKNSGDVFACKQWLFHLIARGVFVVTSDICDYEVRRSLILASFRDNKEEGIQNLTDLQEIIDFLPVTQEALRQAAYLWASSRHQGQPTADSKTLDADVIIAAQCQLLQQEYPGQTLTIATTNVNHLSRFIDAQEWQEITF